MTTTEQRAGLAGRMSRADKRAEAERLRDQGLTFRQIAERLGYANSASAWKLLHPEEAREQERRYGPAKRAWEDKHDRQRCPCGALRGVGAHRRIHNGLCRECEHDVRTIGRAMREERIAEMWSQGFKLREIAEALNSTTGSMGRSMASMRKRGWDLPYRHSWSPETLAGQREMYRRRAA